MTDTTTGVETTATDAALGRAGRALRLACPLCGAEPGLSCRPLDGGAAPAGSHAARLDAVSAEPVALDPDDLACRFCGCVVTGPLPESAVTYTSPSLAEWTVGGEVRTEARPALLIEEPMAVCSSCRDFAADGERLARSLFPNGLTIGSFRQVGAMAAETVTAVLATYAAVGRSAPSDAAGLARAAERLAPVALGVTWERRFAPTMRLDARPGTAAPWPWACVPEDLLLNVRRALADLIAEDLATGQPDVWLVPPPIDSRTLGTAVNPVRAVAAGCLLCGVGGVVRTAVEVARLGGVGAARRGAWAFHRSVSVSTLGVGRSPMRVNGWCCPTCQRAVELEGALGPSAGARSVQVAIGEASVMPDSSYLVVPAWGGLVADAMRRGEPEPEPNASPWGHLGDLADLRDRIVWSLEQERRRADGLPYEVAR